MLCAIHQPNFFPWLGYFDKVRRADVFVFLDDVDYPRAGSGSMGSWLNRVKIAMKGEARWVGCPVKRMPLGWPINQAVIDDSQPWRPKLLKSLEASYGRSRNYRECSHFLRELIEQNIENLSDFNIACIKAIAKRLGISVSFVRQSDMQVQGSATEMLVNIVRAVGANAYLAGGGAQGYQQDELFAANGVELVQQNYVSPIYRAPQEFISGLSIIDYLMHRQD